VIAESEENLEGITGRREQNGMIIGQNKMEETEYCDVESLLGRL
jgi:hypothetical protein